ncbi:MAG: tetratricopeptide repeat protein [Ignavibacteria bacterium]|nr:tetratricopeptide repeat protein [Ignavibacteria bacterium]
MNEIEITNLLIQADSESTKGNYVESDKIVHLVMEQVDSLSDQYAYALAVLATTEDLRGNHDRALVLANEALQLADKNNHTNSKAKALNTLGKIYLHIGSYELALDNFYKALALYQSREDPVLVALVTGNIGVTFVSLGKYDSALECYLQALAVYEKTDDSAKQAMVLGNIGVAYRHLGTYDKAIEYYTKSLVLYDELSDNSGIARITGNIANLYTALESYDKALEYYIKALDVHLALGSNTNAARVIGNIGGVYYSLDMFDKSLEYFKRALSLHENLGEKSGIVRAIGNIANVYVATGSYNQALEYFTKALALHEELGEKSGIAIITGNIAELYADEKFDGYSPLLAEKYFLQSIALSEELGRKQSLYELLKMLSSLLEKTNRNSEAFEYFKKFYALEKEVQSEETKKLAQKAAYERQIGEMQREQEVTERILHNILPKEIAIRIRRGDQKIVENFDSVSVLFADIVGFTEISERISPEELVDGLDKIFNTFDALAEKHGCEKIKTIGDCYMVVAGLPIQCDNHAERLAALSIDMLASIEKMKNLIDGVSINMRIGVHSGSVVAGIIGKNKYSYDLWGDAVNLASRMESHGVAGKIHVSESFVKSLGNTLYEFTLRGEMGIKGKGDMKTYFLNHTALTI